MPSKSSSVKQAFDLQTKENSQELHDKLSNILERFEETRQAIKDNVKMLESVSDATAAIDYSPATGSNTIDSSSSYPYSFSKHYRSMSSNRLSGMDTSTGTGTSYGLRTISSVDSGVMLTLTSCSEAGTQSRSRSFGSWTGGTSPVYLTHGTEEDSDGPHIPEETQAVESDVDINCGSDIKSDSDESSGSDHSSEDEEVFTSSHSEQINCTDGSQANTASLVQPMNRLHMKCRGCSGSSIADYDASAGRFEVQENSIAFEEEGSYDMLSLPISTDYTDGSRRSSRCTVYSSSTDKGEYRRCIVLPALRKEQGHRPTTLNVSSQIIEEEDEWVEKDHITSDELYKRNNTPNSTAQDEQAKMFERSCSTDSRLMFSPIPEESPSELVPGSPSRIKKSLKTQPQSMKQFQTGAQKNEVQTIAEVHVTPKHSPQRRVEQSSLAQSRSQANEMCDDQISQKLKKYRHKRKKTPATQPALCPNIHHPLSSSTSSGSSLIEASQKSDEMSLSSYRNAIDKHAIILPPVLEARREINSSTSSASSLYDMMYTSSSGSSCSDSEYEYQVSLQNRPHQHKRRIKTSGHSLHVSHDKKPNAPVLRKIHKETLPVKGKATQAAVIQESQKPRLFKKNSSSPKIGNSRLMKTKSDEASHSLLRYFRFPSPPRTAAEDNSDSSQNKASGKERSTLHRIGNLHEEIPSPRMQQRSNSSQHNLSQRSMAAERVRDTNACSCATSSTTDTASDIAYPDLSPLNSTGYTSHPRLEGDTHSTPSSTNPIHLQYTRGDNPSFTDDEDGFLHPNHSQAMYSKYHQLPPHLVPATSSGYQLPVQQYKNGKKKKRCSLFHRIFRRQKNKKLGKAPKSHPVDTKLTLDLAGGEVRVKQQMSSDERAGVAPYFMMAPAEQSQYYYRHNGYRVPSMSHMPVADRYYTSRPTQPSPIYVLPRENPHYVPVVKEYAHHRSRDHRPREILSSAHNAPYPHPYIIPNNEHMGSNSHIFPSQDIRFRRGYVEGHGYMHEEDNYQTRRADRAVRTYRNVPKSSNSGVAEPWRVVNQPQYTVLTKRRKHYQIL